MFAVTLSQLLFIEHRNQMFSLDTLANDLPWH